MEVFNASVRGYPSAFFSVYEDVVPGVERVGRSDHSFDGLTRSLRSTKGDKCETYPSSAATKVDR